MAALTIAAANVVLVSGNAFTDQVAGEAFVAGVQVYLAADNKWYKAQCDGTPIEAGATNTGIALATADRVDARVSIAGPGAIVAVGTGTAGVVYCIGAVAGQLVPVADLVSTNKVTPVALGIGTNQLQLTRVYNAGAVL